MADIRELPIRKRGRPGKAPLSVVNPYGGCQHRRIEVDERLAEVTCVDCKAKLNPIWALTMLAREDSHLIDRWAMLRAEIETMKERTRVKCRHCGNMTPLRANAPLDVIRAARLRIDTEDDK